MPQTSNWKIYNTKNPNTNYTPNATSRLPPFRPQNKSQ